MGKTEAPPLFEGDTTKRAGETAIDYEAIASEFTSRFGGEIMSAAQDERRRLLAKLHAAYDSIAAVEKRGKNREQHYDYVRAVDVANEVRASLKALKLFIVPSVRSQEVLPPREGGKQWLTSINVDFTVYDVETGAELAFSGVGQGSDTNDKGVYKAITGALKYGLRSLFLIPDEADDPEYDAAPVEDARPIHITPSAVPGIRQGGRSETVTTPQLTAINKALKESGAHPNEVVMMLASITGRSVENFDPDESAAVQRAAVKAFLGSLSFDEAAAVVQRLTQAAA